MAAIPIHHGPDFGNVPVIEPEDLDILFGKAPVKVPEAFFNPIGQHLCLVINVLR